MAQNVILSGGNQSRGIPSAIQFGVPRRNSVFQEGYAAFFAPLPTDPIGTTTVTFDGLPANVEIRVYDPDLNDLAGIELSAANQVLTWPVYAAGSPNNNVQIKLVSTAYKIKDFPYVSKVGNQSIPVQMEADPWFSNPV